MKCLTLTLETSVCFLSPTVNVAFNLNHLNPPGVLQSRKEGERKKEGQRKEGRKVGGREERKRGREEVRKEIREEGRKGRKERRREGGRKE